MVEGKDAPFTGKLVPLSFHVAGGFGHVSLAKIEAQRPREPRGQVGREVGRKKPCCEPSTWSLALEASAGFRGLRFQGKLQHFWAAPAKLAKCLARARYPKGPRNTFLALCV